MSLLLDTNTINYILRGRQGVVDRLEKAEQREERFLLASVVDYELTRYLLLKETRRLLRVYEKLTRGWERCNPESEDWASAADLWAERNRIGRTVSDFDLLIAVLARRRQATLVTSNRRHFEGLGLSLETWTE